MPDSRFMLLAAVTCIALLGCDRSDRDRTLDTFKFKAAMKAGEVVQESDLEPISIPFHGDATVAVVTADGETVSEGGLDFDSFVTKDELDQFVGKKLVNDVEEGDLLSDHKFE